MSYTYSSYLFIICVAFLFISEKLYAQHLPEYKPKLLRFDEDYSNLTDSIKNKKLWLRTKNSKLNHSGSLKASFGFDYREMYEYIKGHDSIGVSDVIGLPD